MRDQIQIAAQRAGGLDVGGQAQAGVGAGGGALLGALHGPALGEHGRRAVEGGDALQRFVLAAIGQGQVVGLGVAGDGFAGQQHRLAHEVEAAQRR